MCEYIVLEGTSVYLSLCVQVHCVGVCVCLFEGVF